MSKSGHGEVQMIGALKQLEAGRRAEDVAREAGVWPSAAGGIKLPLSGSTE